MKFLTRPKGRDDVCSVTQCALLICKYYKQYSLNCVKLGFFNNLNKTQINGCDTFVKVHMQSFQILRTLIDISDKIKILFTEFKYLFFVSTISVLKVGKKRPYFVSASK